MGPLKKNSWLRCCFVAGLGQALSSLSLAPSRSRTLVPRTGFRPDRNQTAAFVVRGRAAFPSAAATTGRRVAQSTVLLRPAASQSPMKAAHVLWKVVAATTGGGSSRLGAIKTKELAKTAVRMESR